MSNTVIAASLTLDSEQASTSVKSFKAQLREASNELVHIQDKFGETSKEAIGAAKSVAELKAKIKDAKEVADLFNPEKKFQAFGNAIRATVGGVTALTGAMALFGGESKEVQNAILKVQGALALTEGVNTLADAAKDFTRLKVVAQDAFNGIKAAIGSTGIGLFVIALGLIVAYWDDIKNAVGLANSKQEKALEIATKNYGIEKDKLDILTSEDNILKEQGKSEQQILDIKQKQLEITIAAAKKQLEQQEVTTKLAVEASKKWQAAFAMASIGGIFHPEKVKEEGNKTNQAMKLEITKMEDQLAGQKIAEVKANNDFNQKLLSMNHEATEAGITDQYALSKRRLKDAYDAQRVQITQDTFNLNERNQLLSAAQNKYNSESAAQDKAYNKKKHDDNRKLNFEAMTAGITDANILSQMQIRFQLANDIEQTKFEISNLNDRNDKIYKLTEVANKKIADLKNKDFAAFQIKWAESVAKFNGEQEDRELAAIENLGNEENELFRKQKEAQLDLAYEIEANKLNVQEAQERASRLALGIWYADKLKLIKKGGVAEIALQKEFARQSREIDRISLNAKLQATSDTFGKAAAIFEQNTIAYKVLAIAQATINTYIGVSDALAAKSFTVFDTVLKFVNAGIILAAGIANVKKIVEVSVGGSGGGGGSAPSGTISAPLTPQPVVGNTQLPQSQINQIGNATTVRAFVVESDVTKNQDRIKMLNRAARLGN